MNDKIKEILSEVEQTISRKNKDYDNAFDKSCDMFTNTYAASKIYEKTMRVITLTKQPPAVIGESLEDALMDCIGYCTLYLNRLRK